MIAAVGSESGDETSEFAALSTGYSTATNARR
jgi:hypothetical protein